MSVCVSKATLSAMGLGPSLPPHGYICNPFLGNGTRANVTCVAGVPCCAGIPLAIFNPLTYPINANSAQLVFTDLQIGIPNPSAILNDNDLLTFLNTVVLPLLIPPNYTIEGAGSNFQIINSVVYAPRVNGSCVMVMESILVNFAPTGPVISQPTEPVEAPLVSPVPLDTIVESQQNHEEPAQAVTETAVDANASQKVFAPKRK